MGRGGEDLRPSEPRDAISTVEITQGHLEQNGDMILPTAGKGVIQPSPSSSRDVRSARKFIWRIQGVPSDFNRTKLVDTLRHSPDLQMIVAASEVNDGKNNGGLEVHTLARDIYRDQLATVSFLNLPEQLAALEQSDQLLIDIPSSLDNTHEYTEYFQAQVAIDRHFDDVTVLSAPPADKHDLDILAVSGLGSHAFGSFVHKSHGHMWLRDSLPQDMPTARVMIYGYESRLRDSTSFANLSDLASSLQIAICRVLRSQRKHLILIGHSLGGLLIKEALIRIAESDSDSDLIGLVFGTLFFGVPNDGMDIESLISMVNDQPNRFLLESLRNVNPQILTLQNRNFSKVFTQTDFEMFCFYETKQSPTASQVSVCSRSDANILIHKKDASGQYKMNGPLRCLVTRTSATSCLSHDASSDHSVAINRTHSDLVKFSRYDAEYDRVRYIILSIHTRSKAKSQSVTYPAHNAAMSRNWGHGAAAPTTAIFDSRSSSQPDKPCWVVPFRRNKEFVGQKSVLDLLVKMISPSADENECRQTAIEGLGGIGKTQIALEAAFGVRTKCSDCSIFWVPAVDAATFEHAYRKIGTQLKIPGIDDPKTDIKKLVKVVLSQSTNKWLLIIDDADDLDLLFGSSNAVPLVDYLPPSPKGSILFTTRSHEVVRRLKIRPANVIHATMSRPGAIDILQKSLDRPQETNSKRTAELLDLLANLPLAIKQAAANMNRWGMSINQYLEYSQSSEARFNGFLIREFDDHTRYENVANSVANSWAISFNHISRDNPLAAKYLQLISFVAAEDIPRELLPPGNSELEVYEAINWLKGYTFITETADQAFYRVDKLVQLATRNWLAQKDAKEECVTEVMQRLDLLMPLPKYHNKNTWEKLVPHALSVLKFRDHSSDKVMNTRLLFNVAESEYLIGNYKTAEKIHGEALELRNKVLGPEHPDTLRSRNGLAIALYSQGQYKEAEQMYRQALELQRKVLGSEHPETFRSRHDLANALYSQGQYKEAEQMHRRTLKLQNKVLGPDHPDTLLSRKELERTQKRVKYLKTLQVP